MYLLLDSNVVAGYYLPRSLPYSRACNRIENIFESVISGASDHFFYMSNFCVAEVFSVFMKHSFGTWNRHVRRGTIDTRHYRKLVEQFRKDIHNGYLIYTCELTRYHILGIDLVAPIDHYYRISKRKKHVAPMGTFDHLIISIGIQLAHIHGSNNVAIISADDRLIDILAKCKSGIPKETIKRLKLDKATEITGRKFSPEIFPQYANLKSARKADLENLFGQWPLPVNTIPNNIYRYLR